MAKSILGDLKEDGVDLSIDPIEMMRRNRMMKPQESDTQQERVIEVKQVSNLGSHDGKVSNSQEIEELVKEGQQKGKEKKPVRKVSGQLQSKSNQISSEFDWNSLGAFVDDVPSINYGNKAQRLTDENHIAIDEMANRIGVPAVCLLNHILNLFRERFRDEFVARFPPKSL
jgi:hypothetical protein